MTTATKAIGLEATIANIRIGDVVESADNHTWTVTAISSHPITVYPVEVSCHRLRPGLIHTTTFDLGSLLNVSARIRAQEAASVLEEEAL